MNKGKVREGDEVLVKMKFHGYHGEEEKPFAFFASFLHNPTFSGKEKYNIGIEDLALSSLRENMK